MIQLAIIGPTASGKSDLAIKVAKKINAYILSIDSLSIYKEIDIVSAKPSKCELQEIRHFGIDVLYPNEYFSVDIFIRLYKEVMQKCQDESKNLIIVGGTSFYLKMLVDGLSNIPKIDDATKKRVEKRLLNLQESYDFLYTLDKQYMQNISQNDRYRIEKALLIYEASGLTPSEWFRQNPPKPVIENLPIYNIEVEREVLRERIKKRTQKMYEGGLIDEICRLEQRYTRLPHSMSSIGIIEVLEYLDGKVTKDEMCENISTHTAQLAKRQQTFNRTQFEGVISAPLEELEEIII
ncbi:MAG: tRNA (adenosine(37)-N6)-dimethylallyltransferase MiaA [Sulfurimonas sp.]|uniref:tRNA (adenosine(37)-N6)-dimethylallyltransferase MiaA n=1 Tax=Sulfurimonas sp. TaxID=2022749 RepID=UPI00261FCBFC|nr:tRNA (adenosine(37)-N6)-dimethylallyltransferase MiaA [Sulfurimonas sp.]MDD5372483.1 tRNA (adenosine(37)-N6)-dimethylallyltransferase MiaA [Sulfurimonas sp.]